MIARICSSFIEETDRFTVQSHKLAFETDISNFSHILFSPAPVILEEQGNRGSRIPMSAIEGQLKNVRPRNRLWDLDCLRRRQIRGSCEI